MAEILSREKELFKINQELNLMTLGGSSNNNNNQEHDMAMPMGMAMGQSRYNTYLKQKGPSTLLKKKLNAEMAAGGNVRPASGRAHKMTRANNNSTSNPQSPNLMTQQHQQHQQLTKSKGNTMSDWRPSRAQCKYSTIQPTCRVDSSFTRKATHKTATYVKYRNPNFTQSPSLDLLLRQDEDAEIITQQQQQQQQQQLVAVEQVVTQQREIRETRESTTVVNGQSKKHLTQDNFIRFLKAKVVILEEDHGALTQEMSVQRERLDEAILALRNAESQRDQAINSNTKLSDQLQRLEQQLEDASRRQKERQLEYSSQQRELELLRRDNKLLKQANTNLENRLARASDEAEAARQMISQQSGDKREEQELQRKELKVRDNRIKSLKRQRADLLNAYKKQLFMIDNLKRQNSCVEQAVAIGFGEKEFNKVLEWNMCSKSAF